MAPINTIIGGTITMYRSFGVVAATVAMTFLAASTAFAVKPAITNFSTNAAQVGVDGGKVEANATVTNATSCTITGKHVSGLPVTVNCSGGSLTETVLLPANHGKKVAKYKLTLKAQGEHGKATASVPVSVAASPPGTNCTTFQPHADLENCDLLRAVLEGVDLEDANLKNIDGEELVIKGSNLNGADLESAYLYRAALFQDELESASFVGTVDTWADWSLDRFAKANLKSSDFENAAIEYSKAPESSFEGANLHSQLGYDEFPKVNLLGANLQEATVVNTDLKESVLENGEAPRDPANFTHATLLEDNLEGALTAYDGAMLEQAYYFFDGPTVCPEGYLSNTVSPPPGFCLGYRLR